MSPNNHKMISNLIIKFFYHSIFVKFVLCSENIGVRVWLEPDSEQSGCVGPGRAVEGGVVEWGEEVILHDLHPARLPILSLHFALTSPTAPVLGRASVELKTVGLHEEEEEVKLSLEVRPPSNAVRSHRPVQRGDIGFIHPLTTHRTRQSTAASCSSLSTTSRPPAGSPWWFSKRATSQRWTSRASRIHTSRFIWAAARNAWWRRRHTSKKGV